VLCDLVGMTRQNYYKSRQVRRRESIDEQLVLSLVRAERSVQPQLGTRKLLHIIRRELLEANVKLGRDRLLGLLRRHDLLIARKRNFSKTTDSWHGLGVYPNLAKDLSLVAPHQLLVSDITYVRTRERFAYVCLVMDAFSRAVVGYDCSESLSFEGATRALRMAVGQLPAGHSAVHHSDRGSQYCCGMYTQMLVKHGLGISMTEANHCYENAQAERLNGILKQEYGLGQTLASVSQARRLLREAVDLYNHRRPHAKLDYAVPMSVHTRPAA
jgi:putative transposase